ncbi:anaphase-promoting complex subunit 2-like isoform X1 [Papaver somniferum]|uniref:anaphase-promoting complex subunit 2-like isoform X1 n=1 Tax=Papaver somniferum TaxID=3469 RepID=UPI000E6F62DB|nr:anaphase-promoting complex subunit 2-like isoform X1 [Papaver somniferum]
MCHKRYKCTLYCIILAHQDHWICETGTGETGVGQFKVPPLHDVIIMQFQDQQTSWTSKNLAAANGVPVDTFNRRFNFWGILSELLLDFDNHIFTFVDGASKNDANNANYEEAADEDGERFMASVEEQILKEMNLRRLDLIQVT